MSENRNLGSILCPNCGKLISASAESCIHCGAKQPGMWGLTSYIQKIFGPKASLIPFITATCVGIYVLSLLLDPSALTRMRGSFIFGFLSPSNNVLIKLGATGSYASEAGYWWTTITAIYLHGGLLHIAFNAMAIRSLGPSIEEFYGASRSFVIFSFAGIVGYVVSNAWGIPYTVGASGSLFGFLGALVYYGRKRGGVFGDAIYKQAGQWAIVWFIIGFLMPGINNFAHGGGFLGGYAASWFMGFTEIKRENRMHQMLAVGFLALTVLAFVLSIINPPYLRIR